MRLIAEESAKGNAFLYQSEYWQTLRGKGMNMPRKALVLEGEATPWWTDDRAHEWYASQVELLNVAALERRRGEKLAPVALRGVRGQSFLDCTIEFSRSENQGCGVNLEYCRDILFVRCTFRCIDIGDINKGASGYGCAVSGCKNVIFQDCCSENCHIGAMFTDSSERCEVHGWVSNNTHKPIDIHGGGCFDILMTRVRGDGAIAIGNPDLPDGATGVSITDCTTDSLEFNGKIRRAKVQRSAFQEIRINQYLAHPDDSQQDYSMNQLVIDGTTKFQSIEWGQL